MPVVLNATTGRTSGSASSRRLRAQGQCPATLYGHGMTPVSLCIDIRDLRLALSGDQKLNTVLTLRFDGQEQVAVAKMIERGAARGAVQHVDFQALTVGERLTVDVPLVLVGEARDLGADDVVDQLLSSLTVEALATAVPGSIEVDQSRLVAGTTIHVSDLVLPEGVNAVTPGDEIVVKVAHSDAAAENAAADDATAAEVATATAAAEGAEAAPAES